MSDKDLSSGPWWRVSDLPIEAIAVTRADWIKRAILDCCDNCLLRYCGYLDGHIEVDVCPKHNPKGKYEKTWMEL